MNDPAYNIENRSLTARDLDWLMWRQWRAHGFVHVVMLVLVVAGFVSYSLYGSWALDLISNLPQSEELSLPGDIVVRVPAWAAQVTDPNLYPGRLLELERVPELVESHMELFEDYFYSPRGRLLVTGVRELRETAAREVPRGKAVVPENAGWAVGDALRLGYFGGTANGELRWQTFTVVGSYDDEYVAPRGVLIDAEDWVNLTGFEKPNVLVLWKVPDASGGKLPQGESHEAGLARAEAEYYSLERIIAREMRKSRMTRFPEIEPGHPLPMGFVVRQQVLTADGAIVEEALVEHLRQIVGSVSRVTPLLFIAVAIGFAIAAVVTALDYQRGFGIWKALGVSSASLRRLYRLQFAADYVAGTLLGLGVVALLFRIGAQFGARPELAPTQSLIWLAGIIPVAWWGGQTVSILYNTSDALSLLEKRTLYDWWALLRFGGWAAQQVELEVEVLPSIVVTEALPEDVLVSYEGRAELRTWLGDKEPVTLKEHLREAEGLVCGADITVTDELLAAAPELRVVSNCAPHTRNIDVDAATRRGVLVAYTPPPEPAAEQVLALMLAMAQRLDLADGSSWEEGADAAPGLTGIDLHGSTQGLIGLDHVARGLAERAGAFRMRVLFNELGSGSGLAGETRGTFAPLDQLLEEWDFVSLHLPFSLDMEQIIGDRELHVMRPGAVLINMSAWNLVDRRALERYLTEGKLRGAVLAVHDGVEQEQVGHIADLPNVILSRSLGSSTPRQREASADRAIRNVLDALRGDRPYMLANADLYARQLHAKRAARPQ